jgi:alkylation response protein AidB-like acyl-CoA dehydrogenase
MNALTQKNLAQPNLASPSLVKPQHDLHNARGLLEATLRFIRQQTQATHDPYVISRFGDVQIRIEVAAALLERAEDLLASQPDDIETEIAIAESRLASAEALSIASHAEFELTGVRTPLQGSLHDPLRWQLHLIGNFRLNGIHPPSLSTSTQGAV